MSITNTVWEVTYGYAGSRQTFHSEEDAVAYWREQATIRSYVDDRKFQPANIFKVITEIEELHPSAEGGDKDSND